MEIDGILARQHSGPATRAAMQELTFIDRRRAPRQLYGINMNNEHRLYTWQRVGGVVMKVGLAPLFDNAVVEGPAAKKIGG